MSAPVPNPALLKIGELQTQSGVPIKTIRYYEERGLIHPVSRTAGGFRLFHPQTLVRLAFIRRSQCLGLSLQEISELLAIHDRGQQPCTEVRQKFRAKVAAIEQQITELQHLKAELLALAAEPATAADVDTICPIIQKGGVPKREND
ncbi:MAG: heavy metal-responsive transcriptional regulator [Spirulinaceae cyanobacterium RM2_2_10]|nr:heavy metal-responsive transcriptional regulator [Spirulinaceae cyanobacterium SM2_1_0]NJO19495.1 heavy metal-responsive transcriptional regulator [Spirulinaceae cyanobacterium RM2_2_10]